jgi:hypothetical protein
MPHDRRPGAFGLRIGAALAINPLILKYAMCDKDELHRTLALLAAPIMVTAMFVTQGASKHSHPQPHEHKLPLVGFSRYRGTSANWGRQRAAMDSPSVL